MQQDNENIPIILSIRPQWVKRIEDGTKRHEYRNRINTLNFFKTLIYVYETKGGGGRGKVIGMFKVGFIFDLERFSYEEDIAKHKDGYMGQRYAITICNYTAFDRPRSLHNPPQSWRYATFDDEDLLNKDFKFERIEGYERQV